MNAPGSGLRIAPLQHQDLEAAAAIEAVCFRPPWDVATLQTELDHTWSRCWGAHRGATLAGYMVVWDIAGELELLRIATAPQHRRQGVAAALMAQLIEHARASHASCVHLEVRRGNAAAIALYSHRFGFATSAIRRGYYASGDGPPEDAVLMRRDLVAAGQGAA